LIINPQSFRQTFEAFINAFSTYRPLLTRVKDHYDRALDQVCRGQKTGYGVNSSQSGLHFSERLSPE